jgi:Colicin V production protein
MIIVLTLVIMLVVAWTQYRNGLFTSVAYFIMVLLSGLVAFNYWEPIADILDSSFQNGALAGCEDLIALTLLFTLTFLALRLAVSYLNTDMIDEHGHLQHLGAFAVGAATGYFAAGFLLCAVETLPLDERFLGFEPRETNEPGYRSFLPPDRVWLSLMRHAGANPLAGREDGEGDRVDRFATFDRHGTFELRYLRYRRGTMLYLGEFDQELRRKKAR